MKALQIIQPGQLEIVEIPSPELNEGQVLLKINWVGFCGSDLNTYRGLNPLVKYPIVPGHEISAEIVELGAGVPQNFKVGDLCTVNPYTACNSCSACKKGRSYACQYNQTYGVQRNGAMQNYLAVPWQKVWISNHLSAYQLAMVEPLSVGFHAANRAEIKPQDTVVVLGCGMIGMGAIIAAVNKQAKVVAVDMDDKKLEVAKSFGAFATINTSTENVIEKVNHLTQNRGADVVIEAVGATMTYQWSIEIVGFAGTVVFIGYAKEPIAFQTKLFVMKELDIRGSRNAEDKDFAEVIEWLSNHKVDSLISKVCALEEAAEALKSWSEEPSKIFKILVDFR